MTYAGSNCDFQSYKKVFNYRLEVEDFCIVSYQRAGIKPRKKIIEESN